MRGRSPTAEKFFEYFDKNNTLSCHNYENFSSGHGPSGPPGCATAGNVCNFCSKVVYAIMSPPFKRQFFKIYCYLKRSLSPFTKTKITQPAGIVTCGELCSNLLSKTFLLLFLEKWYLMADTFKRDILNAAVGTTEFF